MKNKYEIATCNGGGGDDDDTTPPYGFKILDMEVDKMFEDIFAEEKVKCLDCKGKGEILLFVNYASCKACKGTGKVDV